MSDELQVEKQLSSSLQLQVQQTNTDLLAAREMLEKLEVELQASRSSISELEKEVAKVSKVNTLVLTNFTTISRRRLMRKDLQKNKQKLTKLNYTRSSTSFERKKQDKQTNSERKYNKPKS